MTVLIMGYPDSGKSALAERVTEELSAPDKRIYLATMIPCGEEGAARVERHRKMREGKGFVTVEAPFDVAEALEDTADQTVLLECVSNLAANEMFERGKSAEETVAAVTADIAGLAASAENLVIVSNHFEITPEFDKETILYARAMDRINEELAAAADRVIRL